MKQQQVAAAGLVLGQRGWSLFESKKNVTTWEKRVDVCLLQVSITPSKQSPEKCALQFSAYVVLEVWKRALVLDEKMTLPIFRICGGIAKQSGFAEDYSYEGARYFEEQADLVAYLVEKLPELEDRYLSAACLLSCGGFAGSAEAFVKSAMPQSLATMGQLLLATGRRDEGKKLLIAYAEQPFNIEIRERLLEELK